MPESTVRSLEQEIQALQQQLKEKKGALQETQPAPPEEMPTDKEVLRRVIGERIKEQAPDYQPVPSPAAPTVPAPGAPAYLDPALQPQVQRLVAVAFSKGLQVAIKEAVGTQNAALIDAFHDVMVDQLFDELVKRKLVEPVT